MRRHIDSDRETVALRRQREQQLQVQETELFNVLNTEQGRWTEFNTRLDDIERSLSAGTR
jgi:hypothetical protein